MTPHTNSTPPVDDIRELLDTIADDLRVQLRHWLALSALVRCPVLLTPKTRLEAFSLAKEAIGILRAMLAVSKEAISNFERHHYDRCSRSLDRLESLGDTLENIGQSVSRVLLFSYLTRRQNGHRD